MKDIKNYIIVLLVGMLAFSVVSRPDAPAKSEPKKTVIQYDPVLLAEYSACLNSLPLSSFYYAGHEARDTCKWWYPVEDAKPPLSPALQP